jgi:hypothetical protein
MNSGRLVFLGSIRAHGSIWGSIVRKELPGTQILPGMAHHGALVHHGKHGHLALSKNGRRTTVDGASAGTSRDIATNGPRPIIPPSTSGGQVLPGKYTQQVRMYRRRRAEHFGL